jgi:hypothetical protein
MTIKTVKSFIPKLFLIAFVVYYWVLTSNFFNPFAIGLLAILGDQIISKKSTLGLIISGVIILMTLYMVFALISELSEFEVANQNYNNLFIFGSFYLGLNLVLAGFMFFKYLKLKIN